jgi:DNA-binding LacI/PurR family transcriptional regulator
MSHPRRVTIKTIAEAVGVTHGTVSRALRGDPRVRTETATLVMEKAQELGYRPSRVGRALKTQRTGSFAVVLSYAHDPFYSEVVQAIHDRLFPLERSLLIAATENDLERQRSVAQTLLEQMVDGVFVCCLPGMTPPFQKLAEQIPVVTINCDPDSNPWGVLHDDDEATRLCMQYLIEQGHRSIAYLGAANGGFAQKTRFRAFQEFSRDVSIKSVFRESPDVKMEAGEETMKRWLQEGFLSLPSALLVFNDTLAIGAMKAIRDLGYRVPEDISIVAFDDIEMARYLTPPLTTFSQPRYEMGRVATELMMARLSGGAPERPDLFRGHLIKRGTVTNAV